MSPSEPQVKRTIAFIDGQNLYHAAKEAFGYPFPNYDVAAPAHEVCKARGWKMERVLFYTGIPAATDDPFWHRFWAAKLAVMGRRGIQVFSRPLRYRNQTVKLPDGRLHSFMVGQEKGVDIRLALDIVRLAHQQAYDVALVFSQEQDLSEVAEEIRAIAREQNRWIKIASAYPVSPTVRNRRGIEKSDWIPIERAIYDACVDLIDYRPKRSDRVDR